MKFLKPLSLGAAILMTTISAAHSAELKGAAAISALNGKSFACKSGSNSFTIQFAAVSPDSQKIAFAVKLGSQKSKNHYRLKKNGKLVDKNGGSRRVFTSQNGIDIKVSGRPTAKCTPQ